MTKPRVVFVQKFVPAYRLPFFVQFRDELAAIGIELVLVYGPPDPFEGSKVKVEYPSWGVRANSRIMKIKGRYLYWQNAIRHIRRGDLVIVEHAAKLLDNYVLYLLGRVGFLKLGYFGHGENFLSQNEFALSRMVKKAMLGKVAHWFAYTEVSRQSLLGQDVDEAIISVVNNTLSKPEPLPVEIDKTANHCVYIGGLYQDKRIDILLDSGAQLASSVPGFSLGIIGDGPLRDMVESAASSHSWLSYHGSQYGEKRNRLLAEAQAILVPGAVGLVVMDAFFFKSPIITIASTAHGPEVAYLQHQHNALIAASGSDSTEFTALVTQLLADTAVAEQLQQACAQSAEHYTMTNMVNRFIDGVRQTLAV